jgi:gluconate 2-dehydrogenase gamma chain
MPLSSRRTFLKTTLLTTAVLVMSGSELFGAVSPVQTMTLVQQDLFPHANKLGINSSIYFKIILHHSRITSDEKEFLRNGVQWLNEEAITKHKKTYTKLTSKQRQNILHSIAKEEWGENWINTILTYVMEATLGDPIYGANKNSAGWRWLNFTSGMPRPKKAYL